MKTAKEVLSEVDGFIKLAQVAQVYFGRERTWLYHRLNEDTVNGVKYSFSASELETMANGLSDIAKCLKTAENSLRRLLRDRDREAGRHFTVGNPFDHPLFREWLALLPDGARWLEPFVGCGDIPRLIAELGIKADWDGFDILRPTENLDNINFRKRDTIENFPKGYRVCVTNPPYLSKNSASHRGLTFPRSKYDNLYKHCLSLMLDNCAYIAAIVPDAFITSGLFHERLYGVISLNKAMFSSTDCPVCLALFTPEPSNDFQIWKGENYVGLYSELIRFNLPKFDSDKTVWIFNDPDGEIAVRCVDSIKGADICFMNGEEVESGRIKPSSRHIVRIGGLPTGIDVEFFISKCNEALRQYRTQTHDVFLTSYGGLRRDGEYRKRIPFNVIRRILNKALLKIGK